MSLFCCLEPFGLLTGFKKLDFGQAVQKLVPDLIRDAQMQGAQKLRNEAYIEVRRCSLPRRRPGKLAEQRTRWTLFNSLLGPYSNYNPIKGNYKGRNI
ncbi:MAG: hypothetical protein CSYNP_03499 [Syntrophus sp. SKADARSKE-3]|nr:hypothetical protein [Syntrophus sp. SKADARSKE-3]